MLSLEVKTNLKLFGSCPEEAVFLIIICSTGSSMIVGLVIVSSWCSSYLNLSVIGCTLISELSSFSLLESNEKGMT